MKQRYWTAVMVIALAVFGLSFYEISQAADRTAGKGPGDALNLPDPAAWQTVSLGQQVWYAFDCQVDNAAVLIRLRAIPAGSAGFGVWSPTDVYWWSRGYPATPSGRGSTEGSSGDLVWAGNCSYRGTWYVAVETAGQAQTWYSLSVNGSGVTSQRTVSPSPLPTSPRWLATPTPSAPRVAAPAAAVVPVLQGTPTRYVPPTPTPTRVAQYPANAITLPEGAQTLGRGQHTWYAFQYVGDESQIAIQMHVDPPGSATFTVWSPDVLQRWGEGYFYTPTGHGTPSEAHGGDLFWTGGNIIKGKWYVVVEQAGTSASSYTLTVSGSGIYK